MARQEGGVRASVSSLAFPGSLTHPISNLKVVGVYLIALHPNSLPMFTTSPPGTSADREIQRTLMELLNQLDGFDGLGAVKMVMATNRPDILDPALLRPGRLDRKIEIPLPNETGRLDVLKIHAAPITKRGDIDFESIVKLTDGFNCADLRNVCTEAGLFAIRAGRDYVLEEDFMKASRKLMDAKKLEGKLEYSK